MAFFGAVLSQKRTFLVILKINTFKDLGRSMELGWYSYGLRIAYKNRKGTHVVVGHCSDLFLGHFKAKLVKNGQSWGIYLLTILKFQVEA